MTTVGIDPGLDGAIAILDANGAAEFVVDMPTVTIRDRREIDGSAVAGYISAVPLSTLVCIERVPDFMRGDHGHPLQVARLHAAAGLVRGIAIGCGLRVRGLTPTQWRALVMPTTKTRRDMARRMGITVKDESLAAARRLFPTMELNLAKHEGRAEALLIARAGWLLGCGEMRVEVWGL